MFPAADSADCVEKKKKSLALEAQQDWGEVGYVLCPPY